MSEVTALLNAMDRNEDFPQEDSSSDSSHSIPAPEPNLSEKSEDLSQVGQEAAFVKPRADENSSQKKVKWVDSSSGSSTSKLFLSAVDATMAQCFMYWCNNLKMLLPNLLVKVSRGRLDQSRTLLD